MSTTFAPITADYALGHSTEEQERLDRQGAFLRPATERWLREAGIEPGMRVLDLGCGTGELSRRAADLVGPTGHVLGIDRVPDAIATARRAAFGQRNMSFAEAEINTFESDQMFDALIGRLVLTYQPDPTATLRRLLRFVRTGGIVAFADYFFQPPLSIPARPLYTQLYGWVVESLRRATPSCDIGARLPIVFAEAGLPMPTIRFEFLAGAGVVPDFERMPVDVMRSLLPVAEKFGIATKAEVQIDTLFDRMMAEAATANGVSFGPVLATAFSRVPA